MVSRNEQKKLGSISQWYTNRDWGFYTKIVFFCFQTLKPYLNKGNILEVGPADGEMTKFLLSIFKDITVVDAAKSYIESVKKIDSNIKGYVSFIENFTPPEKYDNILFAHVLEHVISPRIVLKRLYSMLKNNGSLFIVVPNANSLHRQVGVKMGIINKATDLNDADKSIDHKRVYTLRTLQKDIFAAGFTIEKTGGIFLKPLSNAQIQEYWDDKLVEGYYLLGKQYPELCGEIFAICKRNKNAV